MRRKAKRSWDGFNKFEAFLKSTPPNIPAQIPGIAEQAHNDITGRMYWEVMRIAPDLLELHCNVDAGVRRFDALEENKPGLGFRFLKYACRDCGRSTKI